MEHTGTRFVYDLFRGNGTKLEIRHCGWPQREPEWRRIIPVRNPYDTLLSWIRRSDKNYEPLIFVAMWGEFIMRTHEQECFYFPLDVDSSKRHVMCSDAIKFAGAERSKEFVRGYADAWKPVSKTFGSGKDETVPENMIKPLRFAHEWYEHYTKNWGPHYRRPDNMLGELK